ncbi:hypothetical protein HRbin40_01316 [bacterium HR40]|nr:hypothetical protein HRbin40_01316 [bacterium HR40]
MPIPSTLASAVTPDLEACDPGGLMRAALLADRPDANVRELLLCWLLRLPAGLDPALAACRILGWNGQQRKGADYELRDLLREVALWPRERLARRVRCHRRPH